jgi:hypothetical protein
MSALTTDGVQLVAATREGEVAVSADGVSWTWRGAVNQLSVAALANDTPQGSSVPGQGPGARRIAVGRPWPNPWVVGGTASHVAFPFVLAQGDRVRLDVYDVHGRLMASAAPREFETGGSYAIVWTPQALPAGVFFARVSTASGSAGQAEFVVLR